MCTQYNERNDKILYFQTVSDPVFGSGYHSVFAQGRLTLGIGVPIEAYSGAIPSMENQVALAQEVECSGFAALWCRDVPLYDPSFGDVGQIFDPWVWLGYIAAQTTSIALGTGSIILPLRSPVDIAKAAASVDQLTGGRLLLGVASGDRPVEYSVYNEKFDSRDEVFRNTFDFIRSSTHRPANWDNTDVMQRTQVDLLPKSFSGDIPMLVTGNSRQSVQWIAEHASGWLMYPHQLGFQAQVIGQWTTALDELQQGWKPFAQSLYIDLTENPDTPASPIHLGIRVGRNGLVSHLTSLQEIGVNHVLFNVKFSTRPIVDVLAELREFVVPLFPVISS